MDDASAAFDPRARESYRAWTAIPIRFADQDVLGHVNNVAVATYLEHARCTHLIPAMRIHAPGLSTVIARIVIDYLHEMRFPATVDVGVRITRMGNKSFVISGGVFLAQHCCATSEATMVFFDTGQRKSAVPPTALLDALRFMT